MSEPSTSGAVSGAVGQGSLARSAFHLVLGQAASTVLSIILSAVLGRALGATDFGVYYLVTSTAWFAYTVVEWGQPSYLVREVAQHPERAGALLGTSIVLRIAGAVLAALLAIGAARALGYDLRTLAYTGLFIAALLPYSLSQLFGLVFRGHERMDYDALVNGIAKALAVGITVPLLWLGGRLGAVTLAQAVAGIGALATAEVLRRRLSMPKVELTRPAARELLVDGAPLVVMSLAVFLQVYAEAVVLSKLAPEAVVGWYGAAKTFMNALVMPASILNTAAYPRLSRAAGDDALFSREVRAASRPLVALAALAAVGTFLFADFAVALVYGADKFAPSVRVLQIFAPALFLMSVDMLLGIVALAAGRARTITVVKAVAVAVSIGLDFVLIPMCQAKFGNGGLGVVLGFASGELLMLASLIVIVPRGALDARMLGDLARALGAGVVTLAVGRMLPLPAPLLLILTAPLFVGACLALGLISRSELIALWRQLRGFQTARTGAAAPGAPAVSTVGEPKE